MSGLTKTMGLTAKSRKERQNPFAYVNQFFYKKYFGSTVFIMDLHSTEEDEWKITQT